MSEIKRFPLMLPAGKIEAGKPADPVQTIAVGFDLLLTRMEAKRDELKAPGKRLKPVKRQPVLIPYRELSPIGDNAPSAAPAAAPGRTGAQVIELWLTNAGAGAPMRGKKAKAA